MIIDTNFKNNGLSIQLLKEGSTKGLTDIDKKELDNNFIGTIQSLISPTSINNVSIISTNESSLSPSEIISPETFNKIIEYLHTQFDIIFLEGAALNLFPDTKELALFADKVIAVFSANQPIRKSDQNAIEYFKSIKGRLLGSVLNKVKLENIDL